MIGNFSMLIALAEAILAFLPAVGPNAARRSRSIALRTSDVRAALIGRVVDSLPRIGWGWKLTDGGPANGTTVRETLSP